MTMRYLFWTLMLLWLLVGFGGAMYFSTGYAGGINHVYLGGSLILYLLIGLLGWKTYGKPIEG